MHVTFSVLKAFNQKLPKVVYLNPRYKTLGFFAF